MIDADMETLKLAIIYHRGHVIGICCFRETNGSPVGVKSAIAFKPNILESDLSRLSRSEEHTSELQSLMRISYAVFCLKKKNKKFMLRVTTHKNNHTIDE